MGDRPLGRRIPQEKSSTSEIRYRNGNLSINKKKKWLDPVRKTAKQSKARINTWGGLTGRREKPRNACNTGLND